MHSISSDEINLLRLNARSVVRELGLLNDAYFGIGVTLAERHLLIELSACLYPTISEIAERLLLDKSTASRLISKAVKKGYIHYSIDENDKRKRFLQLTEKGKNVLNTFEPIAFNQTKEALLTLSNEEIETIFKGVALYAKGLKQSRLRQNINISTITKQENAGLAHLLSSVHKKEQFDKDADWANLYEAFHQKGFSYLVIKMGSKIIGGVGIVPCKTDAAYDCTLEKYCIHPDMQDLGFDKLLINDSLKQAKRLGYVRCVVEVSKEGSFSLDFLQNLGFRSKKKVTNPHGDHGKLIRDL